MIMCVNKVVKWGRCGGGGRGKVVYTFVMIIIGFVREEVHLIDVGPFVIRGMVDLEGDGGGGVGVCVWRRWWRPVSGNCDIHVGTKFPLVLATAVVDGIAVFRERVENYWFVGEEAPNWIWINGESTPSCHKFQWKWEREKEMETREWEREKRRERER